MKRAAMLWIPLGLALVMLLALPGTAAQADDPPPETAELWEVGVEYIHDYGGWGDLPSSDDSAEELYDELGRFGWTKRFIYGNRWAWEEDFKRSSKGGTENSYLDQVDLAFFYGHGTTRWDRTFWKTLNAPYFGVGGRDHDDPYLVPGDAYHSWGDRDAEWAAFMSCQILSDRSRAYWASAMQGLHLILGFESNAQVSPWGAFGWWFGRYIGYRYRVLQAWFNAADWTQSHGREARVLADDWCHFYDRYGYFGCGDSPDSYYWWWDHTVGSTEALDVDPAALNYRMPVYNVVTSAPSEEEVTQLATAFGISLDAPITLEEDSHLYRVSEGSLDLTVDQQGLYSFIDLDKLWAVPTDTTTLPDPPGTQEVHQIADTFLTSNGLMPSDSSFSAVLTDSIHSAQITETSSIGVTPLGMTEVFTDLQETVSPALITDQQVMYSRHISYAPSGSDPVTFSVHGPGARLKVYVSNEGEVIGAKGGWRAVDSVGVLDTVRILTPTQMTSLYDQLGDAINLVPTLFRSDEVSVTGSTVGYFEQPMGTAQSALIPVYILDIEMRDTENGGSLESTAFIPAAPEMLPPLAAITSISEEEPEVEPGEIITLTAANASQPLSALGYGDNLDFSLGEGPYTYTWRLETTGKVIGTGRSVTYPAGIVDDLGVHKDNDVPMVIVLEVNDGAGRTSSTAQRFTFIEMTPQVQRLFLPTVLKGR